MSATLGLDVLSLRVAGIELLDDGIDAVDENLRLATPDKHALDHLVEAGKPICRRQDRLVVVVVGC